MLTITGGHLNVLRGWVSGFIVVGAVSYLSASYQTFSRPLKLFTHPAARLDTFETKMAACKGRCLISTILKKSRGV